MNMKVLYASAGAVYIILFACLIGAVAVFTGDSRVTALYAVSTAMLVFTVILAIVFFRETKTAEYGKYAEQKQDGNSDREKKE